MNLLPSSSYYRRVEAAFFALKKRWEGSLALRPEIARACNIAFERFKEDVGIPVSEGSKGPRQVVIIGSGPAGYTAALYAARAYLQPIVYEGSINESSIPGGQLMTTGKVENYPGFPDGVDGAVLMANMRAQALKEGAEMLAENALELDLSKQPFTIRGEKTHHQALAVIVATGAKANRLEIPGTRDGELWQHGVSACATCDGPLPMFRNRHLFVIGGGDTAMEEALFLSKFASKVFIVHRREQLRASKAMQKAVRANPKIEIIWNSAITRVQGAKRVENVVIQNVQTKQENRYPAAGVFFAVGHTPNTAFLTGQLKLDAHGYIQVKPGTAQTSVPYVYAAGDVQDPVYRQAITAAGSGCMAAIEAGRALEDLEIISKQEVVTCPV